MGGYSCHNISKTSNKERCEGFGIREVTIGSLTI
jgi:hypothetical protein